MEISQLSAVAGCLESYWDVRSCRSKHVLCLDNGERHCGRIYAWARGPVSPLVQGYHLMGEIEGKKKIM